MTPEQKRIAIAETCGWKLETEDHDYAEILPWVNPDGEGARYIPDYYYDLNAINAAELANIDKIDESFYIILEQLCYKDRGLGNTSGRLAIGFSGWIAHASAANHAEAFGLALGLWTD